MLVSECDGYNEYVCDECEVYIGQYDGYGVAVGDRYDESEKFHYCVECRDESMDWIDPIENEQGDVVWMPTAATKHND